MAEARRRDEWGRASALMALVANLFRSEDERVDPRLFNPFERASAAQPKPVPKYEMKDLRPVFEALMGRRQA